MYSVTGLTELEENVRISLPADSYVSQFLHAMMGSVGYVTVVVVTATAECAGICVLIQYSVIMWSLMLARFAWHRLFIITIHEHVIYDIHELPDQHRNNVDNMHQCTDNLASVTHRNSCCDTVG